MTFPETIAKIEEAKLLWSVRMRRPHELNNWKPDEKYLASIGVDALAEIGSTPEIALSRAFESWQALWSTQQARELFGQFLRNMNGG